MKLKMFLFRFLTIMLLAATLITGIAYAQEDDPPLRNDQISEEPGAAPESLDAGLSPAAPAAIDAVSGDAFSGGPAYDSGWVALAPDTALALNHNLGGNPDDYIVDMQYWASGVDGINQRYYGGADFGTKITVQNPDDRVGAYWRSLNDTSISVYRRPEDVYAERVRIRIWVDLNPDYDSGWVALPADGADTLIHNLGGNPNDYVVDMLYRSPGSGINQRYFGGADFGANIDILTASPDDRVGAYWRSLNATDVTVFRRAEDIYASEVRIRIWLRARATYDSGWVNINPDQAILLSHNIGGDPDEYVIDMQYRTADVNGVNNRYYGGADFGAAPAPGHLVDDRVGAYWRSLDEDSIVIYRRPEDDYTPQIRIRIFRFWKPPQPDYDSGWVSLATDVSETLLHNLGGDPQNYLVDFQFRTADVNSINQRYLGGSDFGDTISIGNPNDRVGAYWRTLTDTSITVYRRPEDVYVPEARVRIWQAPKPDYDSGWIAKAPGELATDLAHNLGGAYQGDYLVDFTYRNPTGGMNQRYYGGADFGALAFGGGSEDTRSGAYWRSLNAETISIYRRPDDVYAAELRVRIWRIAAPDYDSGWISINADESIELAHALNHKPEGFLVQMSQWDTSIENSMNHRHYGGADFGALPPLDYAENDRVGAYWRSLDQDSLTIYRRPEDGFSDFIRIRIWDYTTTIHLPVILRPGP